MNSNYKKTKKKQNSQQYKIKTQSKKENYENNIDKLIKGVKVIFLNLFFSKIKTKKKVVKQSGTFLIERFS